MISHCFSLNNILIKQILFLLFYLDEDCYEIVDYPNNDIIMHSLGKFNNESIKKCQAKCQEETDCIGFSIKLASEISCYLKKNMNTNVTKTYNNYLSGPKNCPINGAWTEYGLWTPCSKFCGNGTMRKFRFCTNPEPAYEGKYCEGNNYQQKECFNDCTQGKSV